MIGGARPGGDRGVGGLVGVGSPATGIDGEEAVSDVTRVVVARLCLRRVGVITALFRGFQVPVREETFQCFGARWPSRCSEAHLTSSFNNMGQFTSKQNVNFKSSLECLLPDVTCAQHRSVQRTSGIQGAFHFGLGRWVL